MADNHPSLQARFRRLPVAVRERAKQVLQKNAHDLVREIVRNVPKDEGELAASIRWVWGPPPEGTFALGQVSARELTDIAITVVAGNEATMVTNSRGVRFQNALLQEYGTKARAKGGKNVMPANPYFRPAYRKLRARFRLRMAREINKVIRETWDG